MKICLVFEALNINHALVCELLTYLAIFATFQGSSITLHQYSYQVLRSVYFERGEVMDTVE